MSHDERLQVDRALGQGPSRPSLASAVLAGIITVTIVVAMVNLGFWQLRRHTEVSEQNRQIVARSSTPIPITEVDFTAPVDDWDFQLVTVEGTWQPDQEVLWRGRIRNGIPGFEILTPLLLEQPDGTPFEAVLVDRGFLPDAFDEVPAVSANPPAGRIEVEAIIRPSVDQPGFGPRDPDGDDLDIVFHADVPRIDDQVSHDLLDAAYLRLVSAQPATQSDVLRPLDPIEPDAGSHLGYALQWFGFSITAVVAYAAWLLTRVRRTRARPRG